MNGSANKEAISVLRTLVTEYVSNPGTESQFINCMTEVDKFCPLWYVWEAARQLVEGGKDE